jgi:hypothetical protein
VGSYGSVSTEDPKRLVVYGAAPIVLLSGRQLLYTFYKDLRAKQNAERLHGIADYPKHRGPGLASLREPQSEDKLSFTGVVSVHTDEQSTTV